LGSYKGELQFQARPPLPYVLAAAESHGSPAYVVYKVRGDPIDHQFFSEPPKEIPHGYMCAYIPDSNNPVHSVQRAARGVPGTDAEKQVWLATYATGPSHDSAHSALGAQTAEQISAILRDQFGILPKRRVISYTKLYPSDLSHPIYKNINRAIIYAPGSSHAYIQQIIKISPHMSRIKAYKL
jgi:hypothetical protein